MAGWFQGRRCMREGRDGGMLHTCDSQEEVARDNNAFFQIKVLIIHLQQASHLISTFNCGHINGRPINKDRTPSIQLPSKSSTIEKVRFWGYNFKRTKAVLKVGIWQMTI